MNFNIPFFILIICTFIFIFIQYKYINSSSSLEDECEKPLKLICYYSLEKSQRKKTKSFNGQINNLKINEINGSLCTHLIIGFASIDVNNKLIIIDEEIEQLEQVKQLKSKFPHLRVLLSLGGGGNTNNFHESFYNSTTRERFINSTLELLAQYSLDGLDVDWEFPGWSKYMSDVEAFPLLLCQLRKSFDAFKPKLLLSIAVSASFNVINVSYKNIELIHRSVDWINLMSYDFHSFSKFFPFVEHNAPLFRRKKEKGYLSYFNTAWAAWYWTSYLKVPKCKLVIGIPFYSHTYILHDKHHITPGSLAIGEGPEFSFSEVCNLLRNCSNCSYFDNDSKVPYAVINSSWISYENTISISMKCKWTKENFFGGCMTYDLNNDDYTFACSGEKKFLLQQTLYNCLR